MTKRQAQGEVKWAGFSAEPKFAAHKRKVRGAKRRGILYETKVHEHLREIYKEHYLASPWLRFQDATGLKYCQPDGLLFQVRRGIVTIVEVKYQHSWLGWNQLFNLYLPVVTKALETPEGIWQFSTVEVVKWFDVDLACPVKPSLCKRVDVARPNEFGVYIWRP